MTHQQIVYQAHTEAEYAEIARTVTKMMSKNLRDGPDKLLLGQCIALVNVRVVNLILDNSSLSIKLDFVETPRVPA